MTDRKVTPRPFARTDGSAIELQPLKCVFLLSLQAFLGQLIFGEAQITLWWVGISLTLSGLLVLQRVSPQDGHQDAAVKNE